MDPLQPWVDTDEVRRLAARLLQPVRDPAAQLPPGEAGFSEGFVGFAGGLPAAPEPAPIAAPVPEQQPVSPTPPPAVAEPSPAIPAPTTEARPLPPSAPPSMNQGPAFAAKPAPAPAPQSARGPFLEKILRFRDWMAAQFHASGLFILDREGSVIFDEGTHGRLHFLARSLARASRRPGATAGNVHVKIGAGTTLEVIPVDTPYGCLVLGAVVPEALAPEAVHTVMSALAAIASPDSPSREA